MREDAYARDAGSRVPKNRRHRHAADSTEADDGDCDSCDRKSEDDMRAFDNLKYRRCLLSCWLWSALPVSHAI